MKQVICALLVAVFAVTGCAAEQETQAGSDATPKAGGILTFGAEQEPANGLNWLLACCSHVWASFITEPILEGAFEFTPDYTYMPNIVESVEVEEEPFTLTYHLRPEAVWSDGRPISAADLEFTWETLVDPDVEIGSRKGYDLIRKANTIDGKTIRFEFESPYAAWRELFPMVLPEHALEGEDFNKVWNEGIVNPKTGAPISSGPFLFDSWEEGSRLTLVRNDHWWGPHPPYVDKIVFSFVPNTVTEIGQLKAGEVDAIFPQPQLSLAELRDAGGLEIQTTGGFQWEFILFNVSRPPLDRREIREAVALALDRDAILEALFRDISPETEVQQNGVYVPTQPEYEEHFQKWTYDPSKARSTLEAAGCREDADGIFACDGERLSFDVLSTAGNELRDLTFEVLQERAKTAGIELKNDFKDPAVVFGPKGWVGGKFDLLMAAFGGVTDPSLFGELYSCDGGYNFTGYCNEAVDGSFDTSDGVLDPVERTALLNEVDEILAIDLPLLPLFQKPMFLISSQRVHGLQINPGSNFAWNVEDWWLQP